MKSASLLTGRCVIYEEESDEIPRRVTQKSAVCKNTRVSLREGKSTQMEAGRFDCDYVAYLMIFAPLVCSIALVEKRQSIRVSR